MSIHTAGTDSSYICQVYSSSWNIPFYVTTCVEERLSSGERIHFPGDIWFWSLWREQPGKSFSVDSNILVQRRFAKNSSVFRTVESRRETNEMLVKKRNFQTNKQQFFNFLNLFASLETLPYFLSVSTISNYKWDSSTPGFHTGKNFGKFRSILWKGTAHMFHGVDFSYVSFPWYTSNPNRNL